MISRVMGRVMRLSSKETRNVAAVPFRDLIDDLPALATFLGFELNPQILSAGRRSEP